MWCLLILGILEPISTISPEPGTRRTVSGLWYSMPWRGLEKVLDFITTKEYCRGRYFFRLNGVIYGHIYCANCFLIRSPHICDCVNGIQCYPGKWSIGNPWRWSYRYNAPRAHLQVMNKFFSDRPNTWRISDWASYPRRYQCAFLQHWSTLPMESRGNIWFCLVPNWS